MLRKLLLTPFVLVLFIAFVLYNGWNLFHINSGVHDLVLSKLKAIVGEDCHVDRLWLGFGSVNMQGVRLSFEGTPYEIQIDELKLGYTLGSLLRGTTDPERAAEEISISKPKVTIWYDPQTSVDTDVDLSWQLSKDAEKKYRALLKEYDFIKRITIDDGEIELRNVKDSLSTRLATAINGWTYTDDMGKEWIRLAGHIFDSDKYNMAMYGQLDLDRGGIDHLNVDVSDYRLSDKIPIVLPDYIKVLSGVVQGHLALTERFAPTRGFNIEGNILLKDGNLRLAKENVFLENIQLQAKIKGRDIEITRSTQDINGSPTRLDGSIHNFLKPEFDLHLRSDSLDVHTFLSRLVPGEDMRLIGMTSLDLSIAGEASHPRVSGSFASDALQVYGQKLTDLSVGLTFEELGLKLAAIKATLGDATLSGSGTIDFLSPEKMLNFDLGVAGSFEEHLRRFGLQAVSESHGSGRVKIFGPIRNPVSTGEFSLAVNDREEQPLDLEGSFRFSRDRLVWDLSSPEQTMQINGAIDSTSTKSHYSLEATNAEVLLGLSDNPILNFLARRFNLNLSVDGSREGVQLRIDAYNDESYEKIFSITTTSEQGPDMSVGTGRIVLLPNRKESHRGTFESRRAADGTIVTDLEMESWMTAHFEVDAAGFPRGKVSISKLDASLLSRLAGAKQSRFSGNLYGQFTLGEERESRDYKGNLWLMDGFLGNVGPLKGQVEFESKNSLLQVKKFSMQDARTDSLSLLGEGTFDYRTNEINAALAGSNVDVEEVLGLFNSSKDVAAGDAMIQVTLQGRLPEASLYGNVVVHNAKILMLDFDEIRLDFGDGESVSKSSLSQNFLKIGNAVLQKGDDFVLSGKAVLPLNGEEALDLDLSGDGNFLAVLPDLAEIFKKSSSEGHLDLKMTGPYNKPDFTGSHLSLHDGELELSNVAPKIDNIDAEINVIQDDYFLNIENLACTIDGRSLRISNTNDLSTLGPGTYEPLRIAGDDLNLGALLLSTQKGGIPLHIPGLMEPGEIGHYDLKGYTDADKLFIAGPWRRPVVRGKVGVRNANLMFPFDDDTGQGNPIARNVMNNIDWDLLAFSEKDTRYVRQFPAGVYVDMEVDKEGSRLEFRGVLKDSTFTVGGKVESTRGEIEYLDLNFRVEKIGAEFDQSSYYPNVYGRAWTVVRDSSNTPSDVYLTLVTVDDAGQEISRGRWDRINVKLSSEHPTYDESQSDIMATLGYSSENIDEQARKAIGSSTDNFLFRPLLRPIERQLERKLRLDVVRFSYAIAQNFLDSSFSNDQLSTSLALLRSSRLVLGKYLTENMYLLYSGELKAGIDYRFQDKGVGLQHVVGLEYRLTKKLLLQMEYDYNTLLEVHKDDKKVWLRHSFPF